MDQITQQNAVAVAQMNHSAQVMSQQAVTAYENMRVFRIAEADIHPRRAGCGGAAQAVQRLAGGGW